MQNEIQKVVWGQHQADFLRSASKYVGLFGGLGNGKTFCACYYVIVLVTNQPNNLFLVGRRTHIELRDSTKEVFMSVLRMLYHESMWVEHKAENSIEFPNGSIVIFRHLEDPAKVLSINLGGFYIDQAEEIDEAMFLALQGRLRRKNILHRKGLITGNPAGHNWCYQKYGLDQAMPHEITPRSETEHAVFDHAIYDKETNQYLTYSMITASTMQNAANLPDDYVAGLRQSYEAEMYQRYVIGSWSAFEGQIIDVSKIRGYTELPEMVMVLSACDPAISKDDSACNTAFVTVGVGVDGYIYDIETIADKWSFLETIDQMKRLQSRHRPEYIGVEDVAYQRALIEAATAEESLKECQIIALKADRDKFRRAKAITPIIDAGKFRTNDRKLLSECSAFRPDAKGKEKKDRVDALVHVLTMVQKYAPVINPTELALKKQVKKHSSHEIHLQEYLKRSKSVTDHRNIEPDIEVFNESSQYLGDDYY